MLIKIIHQGITVKSRITSIILAGAAAITANYAIADSTEGEDIYDFQDAQGIDEEEHDVPGQVSVAAGPPQGYALPHH